MEKMFLAIIVLAMVAALSVAGCLSSISSSNQAAPNAASPSASASASAAPSQSPQSPQPTSNPSQSSFPTQASVSGPTLVVQGQPATFTTTIYSVDEHKNVCGAVNYYIDNYAAGGTWVISPAGSCSASSGSLVLAGADTAKLSPGTHTLKVDWLGNNAYGPSQSVMTFTVTSPVPSPTPTPSFVPTPTPTPTPTATPTLRIIR